MTVQDVGVNGAVVPPQEVTRSGRAPLEETPRELVPRLNEYTGYTKAHFTKVVLLPPFSVDPLDDPQPIDEPLDLADVLDSDAGIAAAVQGVVLTHEQTWRRKGLALGHLLHSLTLAPGEATRVAMLDWSRVTRGTAEETTVQQDSAAAVETRTRALQEVTNGTAAESQHGVSEATAVSQNLQAGLSLLGFSMAAAASNSIATSATSSSASRSVGARQNQDVHTSTEQNAEASRTRRATVVRELSESEQSQASSRVVANYNHMHAMTVLYFEVVEVYDVATRVVASRPCVFVPMALKDGAWLLRRYPAIMAAAADAVGMTSLGATIRALPSNLPLRQEPPAQALGPLVVAVSDSVGTAISEVATAAAALSAAAGTASGLVGMTMIPPGPFDITAPVLGQVREQGRVAAESVSKAVTATAAARDRMAAVPPAGLTPQQATLVAGVSESLRTAATALAAVGADIGRMNGTGARATPRIDPPPPPAPLTADEARTIAALAAGTSTAIGGVRTGLGSVRDRLGELATAAPTPAPQDTSDEEDVTAKVSRRIDEYREYFNQAVWSATFTPRVVHLLLRDRVMAGELLNDVLDPTPVAIIGNTVGFATTSGQFLSAVDEGPQIDLDDVVTSEMALPTGGVFAEAVLGQAVSAERIDLTRFWNWQDSPPPLLPTELKAVDLARSPSGMNLASGPLDPTAAPLRPDSALPGSNGTADVFAALRDGAAFRDMSGLSAAKEVAIKAMEASSSGSKDAAAQATQSFKNFAELVKDVAPMLMTGGGSTLLGGLANAGDIAEKVAD